MSSLSLNSLGQRICILGPSCSGKSTLAHLLSRYLNLPAYHLDLIAHMPHTDWQRRPDHIFLIDHNRITDTDKWIIEGNYSCGMPKRFERATAVIMLNFNPFPCFYRYLKRCWRDDPARVGHLEGASDRFKWTMARYIFRNYFVRSRYEEIRRPYSHLKIIRFYSLNEVNQQLQSWRLL